MWLFKKLSFVYWFKILHVNEISSIWVWAFRWFSGKESTCQRRRWGFDPWIGKNPLEEQVTTHSSILAWRIPWTEELGGLQCMGQSQTWLSTAACAEVRLWPSGLTCPTNQLQPALWQAPPLLLIQFPALPTTAFFKEAWVSAVQEWRGVLSYLTVHSYSA